VPVLVVPVVVVVDSPVLAFEVVKMVIARSGIVLSPELSTANVRFVFSASFCLLGKSRAHDGDGKIALRLVCVLAAAAAGGKRPPPGALQEPRSRFVCGPSGNGLWKRSPPKARATYHAPYPRLSGSVPPSSGDFLGRGLRATVVGGERRPHHIIFRIGRESGLRGRCPHKGRGSGGEQMVRSVADRAFLPAKSLFEQVGDMMILTAKTIVSAIRPPYPYGGEFIGQFLFALQLCWFPMMISTLAFGFGAPGLQAANFLSLFGALDRLGGFFVLASDPRVRAVRDGRGRRRSLPAPRSPPTSAPGRSARSSTRSRCSGSTRSRNLVVPRFLALMLITGLMDIYALIFGIVGGIGAELLYNEPLGGFFATLFNNASVTDLWGSVLKTTLFGAIIAIVCSYKGMTASGGAEGVGPRRQ